MKTLKCWRRQRHCIVQVHVEGCKNEVLLSCLLSVLFLKTRHSIFRKIWIYSSWARLFRSSQTVTQTSELKSVAVRTPTFGGLFCFPTQDKKTWLVTTPLVSPPITIGLITHVTFAGAMNHPHLGGPYISMVTTSSFSSSSSVICDTCLSTHALTCMTFMDAGD